MNIYNFFNSNAQNQVQKSRKNKRLLLNHVKKINTIIYVKNTTIEKFGTLSYFLLQYLLILTGTAFLGNSRATLFSKKIF